MRIAVLLPQPEGPTSTRNSWSSASMLRSLTAGTGLPPYTLVTFWKMTRAIATFLRYSTTGPSPVGRPGSAFSATPPRRLTIGSAFVDNSRSLVKGDEDGETVRRPDGEKS